jgi:hypothetical protein
VLAGEGLSVAHLDEHLAAVPGDGVHVELDERLQL